MSIPEQRPGFPDDPALLVHKTGNESIAGVKTFTTDPPTCSVTPTTNAQLTRKDYVDGLDATNVHKTGAESVAGVKTFTSVPTCTALPTLNSQLTRKDYVDGQVATKVSLTHDETIADVKTFSSHPRCTDEHLLDDKYQLTHKAYVDDLVYAVGQSSTYTPAWTASVTNPTLGNGTLVGVWYQVHDLVIVDISLLIGSTTTLGSGVWKWGPPSAITPLYVDPLPIGTCIVLDESAQEYYGGTSYAGGGPASPGIYALAPAQVPNQADVRLSSAGPLTWGTGDRVRISARLRVNV